MSRITIVDASMTRTENVEWDIDSRQLHIDGEYSMTSVLLPNTRELILLMAGLASSLPQEEIKDGWINPRQKATERAIEAIQELARVYGLVSEQSAQIQKVQDVNETDSKHVQLDRSLCCDDPVNCDHPKMDGYIVT